MTAEELLAAMAEPLPEDDGYCTIDPETRVITIPPEYQLLGVESDEKAERIYFKCPKIVGDDIDLSKLALRVNFRNAGQVVDQYLVDDVAVDGDNITFSWLLSRRVTQYEGDVNFIVCAVRVSGETITNEWNTTLATAQVLEGLEAEVVLPEEETDIVNQLLALAETRLNDVKEATADANTAASNANQKAQEAENAAEDARGVIEQITKDSYLHTALETFVNEVTAKPTAYGNAIAKKIEGFTRQETTTGAQPAPSPDYPMAVQGTGYCGFFDGLYRTIYFDTNGTQSTNPAWFLTDSIIPCKTGDHIKVVCDKADDIDYYGIVYYLDGEWKSRPANNETGEWDVPSGVNGFRVNCGSDSARFDKNSLRHLLIFVNDKYAVCIKAVGSNLCYFDQIMKTAGIEPDGDGIYYVPFGNLPYHGVIWHNEQKITGSVYIRYTRKYEPTENGAGGCYPVVYYTDGTHENIGSAPVTVFQTVTVTTNASKTVDYVCFSYGSHNSKTWIKELMISRENIDYVEPQNGAIYIPVDYPLFEGDKIIQRNGEYRLVRYHGIEIADGTTDWNKNSPSDPNDYAYYRSAEPIKDTTKAIYCDRLRKIPNEEKTVGIFMSTYYPKAIYVRLDADLLPTNDAEHLKQWLSENPLTIIYPLATPTEEPLSSEAQKSLHSIMATDEQTELTIVGVPSDAEIQNQFLLPRNVDGALNTTAYCTAEKNKIVLNELVAQNLDARVNKLEIDNASLAEQTIVVE